MGKNYFVFLSDSSSPPHYRFFDGEKWTDSLSGKSSPVFSPVNGENLGFIPQITFSEADQAIRRAEKAQKTWREVPLVKRAKILHLAADWLREQEPLLTKLLIQEIGKPALEAKDEVIRSAEMIEYFAAEAANLRGEQLSGEAFPGYDQEKMAIVEREPLGLILAISPFNYPVNLSVSKIAPALLTGSAVLFKPPSQGAIVSLYLTEIFLLAGLPRGLLVTLTGKGEELGDYLSTHPKVRMITFTGSSAVGKKIAEKAGMIPLLFECGGNNPALVLPDASLPETAVEIVKGAFSYSGQRCTAIKYVLGFEPTLKSLLPEVVKATKKLIKMGDPNNPENNFGPLISEKAAKEVEKRVLLAKADGAKILFGGKREGNYFEPTILTNVHPFMEIIREETFGPVVSFIKITSTEEALKIIEDSSYGLQASIFTQDEGTALQLSRKINVGTVQINSKPQRGPDHFPFLGVKDSGLGVQGIRYTLEAMTRPKVTVLNKPH